MNSITPVRHERIMGTIHKDNTQIFVCECINEIAYICQQQSQIVLSTERSASEGTEKKIQQRWRNRYWTCIRSLLLCEQFSFRMCWEMWFIRMPSKYWNENLNLIEMVKCFIVDDQLLIFVWNYLWEILEFIPTKWLSIVAWQYFQSEWIIFLFS